MNKHMQALACTRPPPPTHTHKRHTHTHKHTHTQTQTHTHTHTHKHKHTHTHTHTYTVTSAQYKITQSPHKPLPNPLGLPTKTLSENHSNATQFSGSSVVQHLDNPKAP